MNKQTKDALGMTIFAVGLFWVVGLLFLAIHLGVYPGGNPERFLLMGRESGISAREFGDALFLRFSGITLLTAPLFFLFFKRRTVK